MKKIEVKKIVQAIETSDGAGVKLKRSIGTPEANYIDPFLMLDEFGSENKDDYIILSNCVKSLISYDGLKSRLSKIALFLLTQIEL